MRNLQGVHESDTEVQHLIRQVLNIRFIGQPRAGKVERQSAKMLRQGMLLMFPLPHGSAKAVDEDDWRASTDIEIGYSLTMDENGVDGDAFYRGAFQRFKIGRDL